MNRKDGKAPYLIRQRVFPGGLFGKNFIFNGCRYFCLCGFSKASR